MAKKKKQKAEKKSRLIFRILRRTAIAVFIIVCSFSEIYTQSSIAEKKTELAQLEKQIDKLTADNEDLERILASDDIDSYMERLAREEYNYAYPDEARFYDASRN